mgnify:FL=1
MLYITRGRVGPKVACENPHRDRKTSAKNLGRRLISSRYLLLVGALVFEHESHPKALLAVRCALRRASWCRIRAAACSLP